MVQNSALNGVCKCPILSPINQVILQGMKKSFEEPHWDGKCYWYSSALLWNSITVTTLAHKLLGTTFQSIVIYRGCRDKSDSEEFYTKGSTIFDFFYTSHGALTMHKLWPLRTKLTAKMTKNYEGQGYIDWIGVPNYR